MALDTWFLDIKSTLDKEMFSLVEAMKAADSQLELGAADLDDVLQTDEILASTKPALIWQNMSCDQSPKDPLWTWKFSVGAKTALDDGNYNLATLLARVMGNWAIEKRLDIRDYSVDFGGTTPKRGAGTVVMHEVTPQQFDSQSGLRLTIITMKVVRCG